MPTSWSLEADFLQACNCEYGCPCEFEAPPSHGKCEGVGVWHIIRGNGLTFGFAAWPGALHLGGGTGGFVIDSAANPQQRDALTKIASGEAGGMPFEIIRMTFAKLLPPAIFTAITGFVLLEKLIPTPWLSRLIGVALLPAGIVMMMA